MKAFVYDQSDYYVDYYVGKFEVEAPDDIPRQFQTFLAKKPRLKEYAYVQAFDRTWTLISREPFELREGRVRVPNTTVTQQEGPTGKATPAQAVKTDVAEDKSKKNITIGSVLIVIGIALGFFIYAHRPPEGFVDAVQRADSWAFKREPYYALLFIAALFGLAGVVRIISGIAKPQQKPGLAQIAAVSNLEEIRKAKELLDEGAINAAEFEKIKRRALE